MGGSTQNVPKPPLGKNVQKSQGQIFQECQGQIFQECVECQGQISQGQIFLVCVECENGNRKKPEKWEMENGKV